MNKEKLSVHLRMEIARYNLKQYVVATRAGMHPVVLGTLLNEHRPIAPAIAQKILDAIHELAAEAAKR